MTEILTITRDEMLKALEVNDIARFILHIENNLVETDCTLQELKIEVKNGEFNEFSYADDFEFDVSTLAELLSKNNIEFDIQEVNKY